MRNRRRTINRFSVKGQIFFYPRLVSFICDLALSEPALTLRTFRLQQMSAAGMGTHHFACGSHSKALSDRLLRFASRNRFWHREPGIYLCDVDWQPESFGYSLFISAAVKQFRTNSVEQCFTNRL